MSDSEENDEVSELGACALRKDVLNTQEIQQILQQEKRNNPSKFVSHWEMDEEDIDEATDDEKRNNPVIRTLWAAESGNLHVLNEMLLKDASLVNAVDGDGYSPLHRASYEGHVDTVDFLLDHGAAIDAQTSDGWTALHSAIYWGQTEVVAKLIRRGASVNARTNSQQTPLHLAAAASNGGNRDILLLLLMNDFVDTRAVNQLGETARVIAERSCQHYKLFSITDDSSNTLGCDIAVQTSPT